MHFTSDKMCSHAELKMLNLIQNKNVEILTSNGITHKGYVYAIDMVSGSVVIIDSLEGKQNVSIIFKHAIKSVKLSGLNENISDTVIVESSTVENSEDIEQKKVNIKAWLSRNLIEVEEDGLSLKIGDDLVIEPPYDREHCFSGNTIILQRIQDILAKMSDEQ